MFERLKNGIKRSRDNIAAKLRGLLRGRAPLDLRTIESIEEILLGADVGVEATERILAKVRADRQARDREQLFDSLRAALVEILLPSQQPLAVARRPNRPFVILMAGVNGAGKTTTIAKLAHRYKGDGHSVLLAAGDTFRAAAVEQLGEWAARNRVPIVSQAAGADPASVIFDAVTAAVARGIDVVIADTAGRLHTQTYLMDELRKIRRVIGKIDASAPDEVLLVIDATTGQNALAQVQQFREAIDVTGLVLTKLDGSAKGGIVIALAQRTGLPIRYIGVGEGLTDLMPFDAREFVDALLAAPD
ncbi:MAG: signal recognition particle-docking protein FtsY [Gammaproteobacteria bacterium]